ncbi:MAG: hypothetical protein Q9171_003071 [Xanthocarpia ochracea]
MPEGLPEGLVTTKVEVRGELESVDRVDVDDIARLWKDTFAEDVGRRLENFFWRIWGNNRVLCNITGTLVAAIFSKISEGGYIRTTPTQSPRSSRSLGTFHTAQEVERPNVSPGYVPGISSSNESSSPDDDDAGDAEETETESTAAGKKRLPPRPPPILKKPKSMSPPETLQVPDLADEVHRRAVARGPSPEDSTRQHLQARSLERSGKTARFSTDEMRSSHFLPPSADADVKVDDGTAQPQAKSKLLSSRRKPAVIATTGVSRRRPIMRQRSSQSSSSSASVTALSQMRVEPVLSGATVNDTSVRVGSSFPPRLMQQTVHGAERALEQKGPIAETAASSTTSKHDRVTDIHSRPKAGNRTTASHTSFTSLPSILKKSSAAAAPASYQATGLLDLGHQSGFGADRESSGYVIPDDHSNPHAGASESNKQPLPRTKSQLTMLLQKDRTSSHDQ